MREIQTVALVGLGAIGGFLASHLQSVLGDDLRIIAGGERKERLGREGLVVNGVPYRFHIVSPDEKGEPADLAIFITKMGGLGDALEEMRNQIGPETVIMSPLNGVESEAVVAAAYGWERVIYSIARVSVVKKGNQLSFSDETACFEIGEKRNETISERVQAVSDLFTRAGVRPIVRKDMEKAIWQKFVCNVSENQVAAVLRLDFAAWGKSEDANALRLMTADEVIAIAHAKGIDIDRDYAKNHLVHLNRVPAHNKPSTLQDIENGRKTEVDMFAGAVIRLGKETGVPTPVNEFLYHAIRVLEQRNDGVID